MATGFGTPPVSSPAPTVKKLKQTLMKQFAALEDPRVKRKPEHLLVDIVAIAISSGAVWSQPTIWWPLKPMAKPNNPGRETFLALPNGIPSHDTFSLSVSLA